MFDLSKRDFLIKAMKYCSAAGAFGAFPQAFANSITFDEHEEYELEAKAEHVMVFGSPYDSNNWRFSPHMHQEFKKSVQELSGGRIFVKIKDNGSVGIGPKLMVAIARGQVSAGLVSMSNLSPVAKELDILNIPFWSADNEPYINLVKSPIWKSLVLDKIKAQGKIEVLFHYAVGARTATSVKSYNKLIKRPDDLKGVVFRVPASKTLGVFYRLAGATPRKLAWGITADSARRGMFEALDPGIIGLYNGPGNLKDEIAYISRIHSVHDGWCAVVSQEWLKSVPPDLKEVLATASQQTFEKQVQRTAEITEDCVKYFELMGAKVYTPNQDEMQEWIEQCGHMRPEWRDVKKEILGDSKLFDHLLAATTEKRG